MRVENTGYLCTGWTDLTVSRLLAVSSPGQASLLALQVPAVTEGAARLLWLLWLLLMLMLMLLMLLMILVMILMLLVVVVGIVLPV